MDTGASFRASQQFGRLAHSVGIFMPAVLRSSASPIRVHSAIMAFSSGETACRLQWEAAKHVEALGSLRLH